MVAGTVEQAKETRFVCLNSAHTGLCNDYVMVIDAILTKSVKVHRPAGGGRKEGKTTELEAAAAVGEAGERWRGFKSAASQNQLDQTSKLMIQSNQFDSASSSSGDDSDSSDDGEASNDGGFSAPPSDISSLQQHKRTWDDAGDGIKIDHGTEHESSDAELEAAQTTELNSKQKKKRYILFVGNLPYTVSQEDVAAFFSKRGVRVVEVRQLTRRDSGRSRGCCFLEFEDLKNQQVQKSISRLGNIGRNGNKEKKMGSVNKNGWPLC